PPAEVVAGGEEMGGIEADAEPLRVAREGDDLRKVLQAPAEPRALPGGALKADERLAPRHAGEDVVERLGHALKPRRLSLAHVGARMRHEQRDAEQVAAPDLLGEEVDALAQ